MKRWNSRAVIKTREAFEYKISRQSKTIKDFIEYITYERNLKSKASERWKAMNTGSVCPVETSISHHIRNLYKQALGRFPEELRLWTNYLKFCKHANFLSECSSAFEKMLQVSDYRFWINSQTLVSLGFFSFRVETRFNQFSQFTNASLIMFWSGARLHWLPKKTN